MAGTAVEQCTCTECREKFPRGMSGAARGMCSACYRASRPDRVNMKPRADVDVVRETKVGLTEELDSWLAAETRRTDASEAETIRQAMLAAMKRAAGRGAASGRRAAR